LTSRRLQCANIVFSPRAQLRFLCHDGSYVLGAVS
jgi:hypothetical protein